MQVKKKNNCYFYDLMPQKDFIKVSPHKKKYLLIEVGMDNATEKTGGGKNHTNLGSCAHIAT